ncbi:metallophosphatase domain-containing protein [Marinobacter salicampi]|uniref:metallophosphatase domain-containing protein n=1 Tax=Marinobacter salicampi TaxID=435907 RepID=UPI00140AD9CF|nr:metallophosphatase domain-containing protein [Marinobacter salicampi]
MRIVMISDTHSMHRQVKVPDGDLLIHAGDCLGVGTLEEVEDLNDWLGTLPHRHKVVIAGNHDWCFQTDPEAARQRLTEAVYLEDSGTTIEGLKLWGSPWTPVFFDWAFNLERGDALAERWARIPDDTEVLITHGPPAGILDKVSNGSHDESVGCADLLAAVERVRPRLHVFGHIHEGYGRHETEATAFINASTCLASLKPLNPPVVIDF